MKKSSQNVSINADQLNRTYGAPEVVRQRQRTLQALDIRAGEKVLDIGCGTGFLTWDLAALVGESGEVTAVDLESEMVDATKQRCADLPQVKAKTGAINALDLPDNYFDVVTCTQVLLYVYDVPGALGEIRRVLRPGGRVAVLETDWRGMVINADTTIARKMTDAWDEKVASPNLPVVLNRLLADQDFDAIRCEAIPVLNTSYASGSFSAGATEWLADAALKQGTISEQQAKRWREELKHKAENGEYFFCLNRFLFTAVKCGN